MVPHRDVWRDLPFVVSDLFKGALLLLDFSAPSSVQHGARMLMVDLRGPAGRGGSRSGYSALG